MDQLQGSLSLPAEIQIQGYLGKGARSHVFAAMLGEDTVIVKTYREEMAQKYRDKYDIDIAEFEFGRNKSLYEISEINKYIARPYRVYPASSEYTHCMIQEFITGRTLKDLIIEMGYLPREVLDAGYHIIR
ncbi:MAG: hypothetical protein HKN34_03820, partial [Gammaproteobacteria bacterium]|nr:hypothetical protein [Gammaproteobacteria bacterium]